MACWARVWSTECLSSGGPVHVNHSVTTRMQQESVAIWVSSNQYFMSSCFSMCCDDLPHPLAYPSDQTPCYAKLPQYSP
jgi:hypothetical protein